MKFHHWLYRVIPAFLVTFGTTINAQATTYKFTSNAPVTSCTNLFDLANNAGLGLPHVLGSTANPDNSSDFIKSQIEFTDVFVNAEYSDTDAPTQTTQITNVSPDGKLFDWKEITTPDHLNFDVVMVETNKEKSIFVNSPPVDVGFNYGDIKQPFGSILRVMFCSEFAPEQQPAVTQLLSCPGYTDDQVRTVCDALGPHHYFTVHTPGPTPDQTCRCDSIAARDCLNQPVCDPDTETCPANVADYCNPNGDETGLPCCSIDPFTRHFTVTGTDANGRPIIDVGASDPALEDLPLAVNGRAKGIINNPVKGSTCDTTTSLSGDVVASQQCDCDFVYPYPPDTPLWCCSGTTCTAM